MKIGELRTFVAVAETGSVQRAARRLNMTQPAATRHVQRVESEVGAVLFDRGSKPLALTSAGRKAIRHSLAVLREYETLRVAFSTSSEPQGEFRLGVGHAVSELALSEPIDGLRQSFPQLSLSVSSDWSRQLIRNAEQNEIDAAIVVMGDHQRLPSRLTAKMIGREQLHVVGPRDWPLDEAPMEKLAETSWVLNPVGCGYRASLQSAIDDASGELNVAVETMGHELQLSLVSRRAGLGLMPERKLRQSAYRNAVKVIRVTDQSFSVGVWAIRAENIGNSASVIDHLEAALLTAWT